MYIARLKLKKIRCFENLEINFDKPGSSILILGDNGNGKSTILRSLAMGVCDQNSAAALFRELPGEFVRREFGSKEVEAGEEGEIHIDLDASSQKYRIKTTVTSLEAFERVSQEIYELSEDGTEGKLVDQEEFPWDQIFISAYGAGLRTRGTLDFQHFLAVDAVYPLFSYEVPLQNPELVIRRLVDAAQLSAQGNSKEASKRAEEVRDSIKKLLKTFLNLEEEDSIDITSTGIRVKGHWGSSELGELGDGYRSVVTLVLDLIAWWFLDKVPSAEELKKGERLELDTEKLEGIVIVDEIEQHLHPRWQREIIGQLHSAFPKLQFIMTSHSALCAVGTTDIPDDQINLVALEPKDGTVTGLPFNEPPRRQRIDQILTSDLFSMTRTMSDDVGDDITHYASLKGLSSPSPKEQEEILELKKRLTDDLPFGATKLQIAVERAVEKAAWPEIERIFADKSRPDKEVLNLEVKRQLRRLFGETKAND